LATDDRNLSEHQRTRIILMANSAKFTMLFEEIQRLREEAFRAGIEYAKEEAIRP